MVAMDRGHIVASAEAHLFDILGEIAFHPIATTRQFAKPAEMIRG
jgi:hypothetical protein